MVKVISGKGVDGKPCEMYIDGMLQKALDIAKERVIKRNWDYLCIVSGLPRSGKSTLARTIAKYCCPWFDEKYIAFRDTSGKNEVRDGFIEITTDCPEYSAVILDESFASLNTKVGMSPEFIRIINHMMVVAQKHLFIILCLPNYFDLSKGVAVFRSSHLFITYADRFGHRGRFMAFGRDEKRKLYVKGGKFMDYNCVRPNFKGKFAMNLKILDDKVYESMKLHHLKTQDQELAKKEKVDVREDKRNLAIYRLRTQEKMKVLKIAELYDIPERDVYYILKKVDKMLRERPKNNGKGEKS